MDALFVNRSIKQVSITDCDIGDAGGEAGRRACRTAVATDMGVSGQGPVAQAARISHRNDIQGWARLSPTPAEASCRNLQ